jgi:hypothetical protein
MKVDNVFGGAQLVGTINMLAIFSNSASLVLILYK